MFATLKRFYHSRIKRSPTPKPPAPSLPLGLSRDQLEAIQALTEAIPYKHYSVALERLYEQCLAALLRPGDHDQTTFYRAGCFWIEQIATLPHDLTLKLRELDDHARKPGTVPDSSAAFASSVWWDAYQRLGKPRQYGGAGVRVPQ